jgi:hypothetical protein
VNEVSGGSVAIVLSRGVPPTPVRTIRSTNSLDSMISIAHPLLLREAVQSGNMPLRWCTAGMAEASKRLRRVNGHLRLAAIRRTVDDTSMSVPRDRMTARPPPNDHVDRRRNQRRAGHPLKAEERT